jgi:hypothetical protein
VGFAHVGTVQACEGQVRALPRPDGEDRRRTGRRSAGRPPRSLAAISRSLGRISGPSLGFAQVGVIQAWRPSDRRPLRSAPLQGRHAQIGFGELRALQLRALHVDAIEDCAARLQRGEIAARQCFRPRRSLPSKVEGCALLAAGLTPAGMGVEGARRLSARVGYLGRAAHREARLPCPRGPAGPSPASGADRGRYCAESASVRSAPYMSAPSRLAPGKAGIAQIGAGQPGADHNGVRESPPTGRPRRSFWSETNWRLNEAGFGGFARSACSWVMYR